MTTPSVTRKSLGLIGILGGFLSEAAAALPFVASEVMWVTAAQSIWFHLAAAVLIGSGGAAFVVGSRSFSQWIGPAFLFSLLACVLPVIGPFAILILTLVLVSHHAQEPPVTISLVEVKPRLIEPAGSLYGPGPLPEPLVSRLDEERAMELQKIVLGLESMSPSQSRPILHKLQRHPDVRVQLYANGLLNDQLDALERQLATLKQRVDEHPSDEDSQTAIIETYQCLFESHLIASDETDQIASQALRETDLALALNPSNPTALVARVEFQLILREFRGAAITVEQLRHLPGYSGTAAKYHAHLLYDMAAAQDIYQPPPPASGLTGRNRAAL